MTSTENIKELFFNSLKRGTGEAYLILKNNPTIDFSALIVKGATKNYAYDPQCEGSRASYIYRLIQKSKQKEKIIKTVLKKWQTKTNDFWSSDQMFDLAVLLYKEGYLKDKNLLYERFEDNYLQYSEFWGEERLIAIDGVEGILKVAEVIGKTIFENPENWVDSYMIDDFQKRNKAIDIYAELERASMKSQNIKAYYNSILENKWKVSRIRKIKRFSYELVKESIEDRRFGILQSSRNIELTDTEVEKLANEFLSEKDNQLKERYLRFFRSRKFPFDYKPIFQIASGKNPKKTRLVEFAVESLKHFSSDEIRQLALDKFKTEKNPCDYLCLLVGNYQKGDDKILTEITNRSDNYDFIHSLVWGYIEIYKANPTEECKEPLEGIYNKMNCGLHRADIVKILIDNNVLSDKIFKELEFDSYDEVRKLFRQKKNCS